MGPTLRGRLPVALADENLCEQHVEGAIPNGARFVKVAGEDDDIHKPGEQGTVIGSVGPVKDEICYFVSFDDTPPGSIVFVRGAKIREVASA